MASLARLETGRGVAEPEAVLSGEGLPDTTDAGEQWQALRAALEIADLDGALESLARLQATCGEQERDALRRIQECLEGFDFGRATEVAAAVGHQP